MSTQLIVSQTLRARARNSLEKEGWFGLDSTARQSSGKSNSIKYQLNFWRKKGQQILRNILCYHLINNLLVTRKRSYLNLKQWITDLPGNYVQSGYLWNLYLLWCQAMLFKLFRNQVSMCNFNFFFLCVSFKRKRWCLLIFLLTHYNITKFLTIYNCVWLNLTKIPQL